MILPHRLEPIHFLLLTRFSRAGVQYIQRELCRVAKEVRIFPLLELGTETFRHLRFVTEALEAMGFSVIIDTVSYEFQRGGNRLVRRRKGG